MGLVCLEVHFDGTFALTEIILWIVLKIVYQVGSLYLVIDFNGSF